MKKVMFIIVGFLGFMNITKAATIDVSVEKPVVKVNEEFSITVDVSNSLEYTYTYFKMDYDDSKMQLINSSEDCLDKTCLIESDNKVTLTFKALAEGNIEFSITGYYEDDTAADFKITKNIKIGNYVLGDMNKNDYVDMTDILLLIKLYFNKIEADEYYNLVGDLNQNNKIDTTDILLLIKTYFGKI